MKMTTIELCKQGYRIHHTACRRGYTPVGSIGTVIPYSGRFGTGYIRVTGKHQHTGSCKFSTNYEDIEYWVK